MDVRCALPQARIHFRGRRRALHVYRGRTSTCRRLLACTAMRENFRRLELRQLAVASLVRLLALSHFLGLRIVKQSLPALWRMHRLEPVSLFVQLTLTAPVRRILALAVVQGTVESEHRAVRLARLVNILIRPRRQQISAIFAQQEPFRRTELRH